MADITHIRVQAPRKLELKESQQSLTQWKMQFRQYMKQGTSNRFFLASDTEWNPNARNYGFTAETDGQQRTAAALMDDCKDFLFTLATFLPHGYLTEKIVNTSTSFESAFDILEEHFGLKATQESFLELESFTKASGESYRQFYERLLAHVRRHLVPTAGVQVDGATVAQGGDRLTVSHMNNVALMWLRKIHPEMISIVRTEYSLELRNNTAVSSLVPRISVNIDNLLAKYDKVGHANLVHLADDDEQAAAAVRRTFLKKQNKPLDRKAKSPFCPSCYSLAKKSNLKIHHEHSPAECPKKAYVSFLQTAWVDDEGDNDIAADLEDLDIGKNLVFNVNISNGAQQETRRSSKAEKVALPAEENQESNFITESCQNSDLSTIVRNVKLTINSFRKELSPSLNCIINSNNLLCIIDEGSQINCISYNFAQKTKIPIETSNCKAVGAGQSAIDVVGVTKYSIIAEVIGVNAPIPININLGKMVVIKDLGADALVGQPGKVDNQIICVPHTSNILFRGHDGNNYKVSYPLRNDKNIDLHDVVKVSCSQTLYPGDALVYKLPNQFCTQKKVLVTNRPTQISWVSTRVLDIHDGCVSIENDSKHPVYLKKHEHIADIKSIKQISIPSMVNKVLAPTENYEHYEQYEDWNFDENFIDDVQIDPDNMFNKEWKQKFKDLCVEFSDIINYRPSKYNGWYGDIDNSIDFASSPPPTKKIHMPKYSDHMNQILAEKMDQLEKWEVLVPPEKVGVVPVFVCPSMLMPKENNQWRLVTDFTSLNKHIRKPPSLAPTIEETKLQMAKFKYMASLDLSNFYYQNGMKREDLQYLATQHPYKGIRIYKVEPQGLRGASEHGYERLSRVFGEMCQEGKMARQADGLFVGGDTLQSFYDNLREVFVKLRNANFTIKPSKIIINPQKTVLFGWMKNKEGWEPTEHTITPLLKAETPKTIKQLRGFLGAIKQVSSCIENYAVLLSPLEKVAAGRGSSEVVTWNDQLLGVFDKAKQSLHKLHTVYTPKPNDILHTFSDWSQSNGAVGGRLEVHRKRDDGTIDKLHGGFFSARVSGWQQKWLPCEGECLAARLVLQHFKPLLQHSNNTTIHHTDSMPTFQAWQRAKTGAFSSSARIAAFLTEISTQDVDFVHTSGTNMSYSDYASRNSTECPNKSCQICKYLNDLVFTADNIVRAVNIEDIERGNMAMPYTQQAAWRQAQSVDKTLSALTKLINTGQMPEKKKTCGEFTILKHLYNLYSKGDLKLSGQGLITVTQRNPNGEQSQAIVVPQNLFPGLAHAIHLKTMHASKMQMNRLMSRYFYAVGHQRMIEEVVDSCSTCLSLKQLPKELFPETTGEITGFGSHFACDVMVRNTQKILLIREKLTQFTLAKILDRETADDMLAAIISLVADMIPECGTIIRTDNAPQFQCLNSLSDDPNSWLNKFNIKIELGSTFNHNRNPIAENLVKECHKEINRAGYTNDQLNTMQLSLIIKNINSRVRNRGLSAKEMCFMRDQATNRNILHKDEDLKKEQKEKRISNHNKPSDEHFDIDIGDEVMVKDQMTKLKPREKFVVVSSAPDESKVKVQKRDKKFTARQYDIPKHQLMKVPRKAALKAKQNISEWSKLCAVSVVQNKVKLHAWDHDNDDEDPVFYTKKTLIVEEEDDEDPSNDTTHSDRSTTTDHEYEEDSSTEPDDSFRLIDNENLANWGDEDTSHEDDEDSTPREGSQDSFHDAQENNDPDYCPGPGLLRNILEDNRTFLNNHPKRPDRTENQKVHNILRKSTRATEKHDYREMHGIRKYNKK